MEHLDEFIDAYLECMLWTENITDLEHVDPDYIDTQRKEATSFYTENHEVIESEPTYDACNNAHNAGHDFWLTRNRHGAGFWDGEWQEPAASILTLASEAYGETWVDQRTNDKD